MERPTVLVIEDSVDLRNKEATLLRAAGFDVVVAGDGSRGCELARERLPDVIVTDAMLPGKTGFDICAELKRDPACGGIPILITTSITEGTEQTDEHWRRKTGADDFMSKPFSSEVFVERVRKLLARR